jgi:folate-dependent phosphoribosylglycinamide formyltransferase PurN
MIERKDFSSLEDYSEAVFRQVRAAGADLVVLAGFFRRIVVPDDFANRVVGIHPSLVPAFCGRGFYSHRVHEAVLEYGVKVTGCTVHFIDNEYDHGPVILQMDVPVLEGDTLDSLEARVFATECQAYPRALQLIAEGRVSVDGRRVKIAPEPPAPVPSPPGCR